MSLQPLGNTRSRRALDHLLQTPDTFVRLPLPGMVDATAVVHAAPALGAAFVQYTAEMQPGGRLGGTLHSRFVYVVRGAVDISHEGQLHTLEAGGFAYLPTRSDALVKACAEGARVAVIEKSYVALDREKPPRACFGSEAEVAGKPLPGNDSMVHDDIEVRSLVGADPLLDFAVNTMTYVPGAQLPMVEVHVMEHGLLMLEGEGIYRLGDAWYPVTAGDFIWMGAFCPQWFGALGRTPARYLIYKNLALR